MTSSGFRVGPGGLRNKKLAALFLGTLWASGILGSLAQQVDPFYLRVLEKAEKALRAGDHAAAAKDFEVAAFGFGGDSRLKAKALLYLGVAQFSLKDVKSCEKNLRQAMELLAAEDWKGLGLIEEARPELEKLLDYFGLQAEPTGADPKAGANEPRRAATQAAEKKEPPAVQGSAPAKVQPLQLEKLREGDLVPLELVESPPVVLKQVPAVYPEWAKSSGQEGTVIVSALVSEKGRVLKTEIIRGVKGAPGFNQAAEQAVKKWKFQPATIKEIKVRVWIPVSIQFRKSD